MADYSIFYQVCRFFRKNLNGPKFRVRRVVLPKGIDGDCQEKPEFFLIRIEKTMPPNYAVDILIHEVAHCLSWNKEDNEHGKEWGIAYSVVYNKFLEWLESFNE